LRIDLRRRGCWERLLGLLRSLCFCIVESIESIRLSVVESLGRSAYVKKRGCVHASSHEGALSQCSRVKVQGSMM